MKIEIVQGPLTRADADFVTSMRMTIFREWPYLYAGDLKTEAEYIASYVKSPNSFLVIARSGEKRVGVVTGIPLSEIDDYLTAPFKKESLSIQSMFYLGEILLLKEFRKKGIGYQMHQAFEKEVRNRPRFSAIAIICMKHQLHDPRQPKDYKPLEPFWNRLGYVEMPNLSLTIPYQEIGRSAKTDHLFLYSLKDLNSQLSL